MLHQYCGYSSPANVRRHDLPCYISSRRAGHRNCGCEIPFSLPTRLHGSYDNGLYHNRTRQAIKSSSKKKNPTLSVIVLAITTEMCIIKCIPLQELILTNTLEIPKNRPNLSETKQNQPRACARSNLIIEEATKYSNSAACRANTKQHPPLCLNQTEANNTISSERQTAPTYNQNRGEQQRAILKPSRDEQGRGPATLPPPLKQKYNSRPIVRCPRPRNLAASRLEYWCELTISTTKPLLGNNAQPVSPRAPRIPKWTQS